jgi:ABC-type nitrate/sulfonate/bicarbonate transport system substrate-binding protein
MRRSFFRSMIVTVYLTAFWFAGPLARVAEAQPKPVGGPAKIRIAIAPPSLSYLPIYVAAKRGFFTKRGLDVELIQMTAPLTAAAVLNRSVDYTLYRAR